MFYNFVYLRCLPNQQVIKSKRTWSFTSANRARILAAKGWFFLRAPLFFIWRERPWGHGCFFRTCIYVPHFLFGIRFVWITAPPAPTAPAYILNIRIHSAIHSIWMRWRYPDSTADFALHTNRGDATYAFELNSILSCRRCRPFALGGPKPFFSHISELWHCCARDNSTNECRFQIKYFEENANWKKNNKSWHYLICGVICIYFIYVMFL